MYFTGKGDEGKTEIGGKKFAKDSPIFKVLGEVDELNSLIGLAKNYLPKRFFKKLTKIQNDLFIIQANVAYYLYNVGQYRFSRGLTRMKLNFPELKEERIKELEKEIREIEEKIKTQKGFVIYGSDKNSAWFDYLRGVVRRVEREIVQFYTRIKTDQIHINTDKNNPQKSASNILKYINRLSSYFYALARFICYNKRIKEKSPWY
jgi:cob(I)alamin adenosyltransferase